MDTYQSGIPMTPENRLGILRRAREILSKRTRWTGCALRQGQGDEASYCVLGACEQAAYDLGLAEVGIYPFQSDDDGNEALGYRLGIDLSIDAYAREKYGIADYRAYDVNDTLGYEAVMNLLDEYIAKCEAGQPNPPQ